MAAPAAVACYAPDAATWDHVVRAVAHTDHLGAAALLMRATRAHAHDAELLWLTRAVRGGGEDGETLLSHATRRLEVARVAEILAACPTPASRAELLARGNRYAYTALHWACAPGGDDDEDAAAALVELLLGAGANPRARARFPDSDEAELELDCQPIHEAARWSARLVQRLVQAGASIDGDDAGNSTLREAAVARTARGVRMIPALVALGARETLGNEAIQRFAFNPVAGAPPSDGDVAAALTALVSVGCSLTQPNAAGSPLELAALSGNAPVVRALLALGVAATAQSLVDTVANAHPGVARLLLAAGAPVDAQAFLSAEDNFLCTPLMAAAFGAALESVQLLLGAGASAGARNEHDMTALMLSLWSDSADASAVHGVVEALLAAGADVAARDYVGKTPLHHLATNSSCKPWAPAAARLLLAVGADGRVKNDAGATPAEAVSEAARGGELHRLLLAAEGW
jgi:hypothetical protein